ncbi:hypothetical protein CDV36_010106 [Fusarium kuroshium]|uniref:Rhodopsin domain-containing protein n=2 Tax=Fusarium solani species complex TaxID=232080 RepID=A0A3M2RYA0_9HYPO|nr:hypothetical protein CDV36_010106 [Fusarium kuroshium]
MDLDGPALAPPKGVTSNFVNPPNNNPLALGVFISCCIISTICIILRGYGRVFLLRKVQIEEVLAFLGFVGCFWGSMWACFKMVETPGFFVNQWNVRLRDIIPMTYYVFIFGVFYSFVLPFLKIAILVEWCRVFVPRGTRTKSAFWWGCVIVIFVQITANIAIIVALNLQCTPHEAIWDFRVEGKCFNLFHLQVSSATIHLICDITIMLLPQRVIWKLNMGWKKKLGVSVIFSLGLLACISAAFRLASTVAYGDSPDGVYNLGPLIFWATAEMTCGFFIVCVPCVPKILRESGVLAKIKKAIGMATRSKSTNQKSDQYGDQYALTPHGKMSTTVSNAYYKLDEDGVPMKDMNRDGSESTEHLHDGPQSDSPGITRTTQIIVSETARGAHDERAQLGMREPPNKAWVR